MNKLINKKVNKCSAQDCKQTPIDLAENLLKMIPIKANDILYEPFRGDGNFYNLFPKENVKIWSEIKEGKDFFDFDSNCDWCITNPPWSKITKILNKLVKICNIGFALLIHSLTISPNRIKFIEENGFIITKYHMVKVTGWFSHSVFIICEKKNNNSSCVSYDSKVYQMPKDEKDEYYKLQKNYQKKYYLKNKEV